MSKIFLLDDKQYGKRIQEDLQESDYELKIFSNFKELLNSILTSKPQLIFLPASKAKSKTKLLSVFSFIPTAVYGEFGKNLKQSNKKIHKLLSKGYAACITVQTILNKELLLTQIAQLLSQALSKEDIWQKEYNISLSEVRNKLYRNLIAVALSAAVTILLIFAFKEKIFIEKTLSPKFLNLPSSNISGITISKNFLWSCDWQAQNIYKHSIKFTTSLLPVVHVYSFPGKRFASITSSNGHIWTLDPWQKKVYKHILDRKLSIISEYDLTYSNPVSITSDGKYLLCCDNATNKLYIHKLDEKLSMIKDYTLPGKNIVEIFSDRKFLWTIDSAENKIYRCKIEDFELKVDNVFLVPEYEQFEVTAISGDENYLYLASEKIAKIYRIPKNSLEPLE